MANRRSLGSFNIKNIGGSNIKLNNPSGGNAGLARLMAAPQLAEIGIRKKMEEEKQKASLSAGQDLNKILNLSDNLIASIKAANLQQGGGGPAQGIVGNLASKLGLPNTGNISALKNVSRDTALAFTKVLAGGARGVATLFENVLGSIPDNKYTSEQAGSTVAELMMTAYGFKKGVDEAGLSQQQLNDLTPEEASEILARGRGLVTPEENKSIYTGLSNKFRTIQPRQQIDLGGNVSQPQINPLSKFLFGNKSSAPVNPSNIATSASQAGINVANNMDSIKQKLRNRYLRGV